jgi:MFS family permease
MQATESLELERDTLVESHGDGNNDQGASPLAVLKSRNFRLLWLGEAVSMLGDQFYMIALPWLVLRLTGDALAVGTVLAAAGIPRAIFMLVGGAFTDRFSPRNIMLASNLLRLGLTALLALTVFAGLVELWLLYIFALLFGLADAFFFPAQSAMVPHLVDEEQLQSGNAIMQGTAQLSLFLGPIMAGGVIAYLAGRTAEGSGSAATALGGIALAFAIDALTFLASALTLWLIKLEGDDSATDSEAGGDNDVAGESVIAAIRDGVRYVWGDRLLRSLFILVAAVSTQMNALIAVGVPVLADARLAEGAAAFGLIVSAFGAGTLLGMALAGALPRPPEARLGAVLLLAVIGMGAGIVLLGFASTTLAAALTALVMGLANGYVSILFITWLQVRTPREMLGRMMSLLMFASIGLMPLASAAVGALSDVSMTGLFVGAGLLVIAAALWGLRSPTLRSMGVQQSA